MTTCSCLDLVRDEVARLQRIRHSSSAHADTVAHTDRSELVANETRVYE
jgi:hypothetical protein